MGLILNTSTVIRNLSIGPSSGGISISSGVVTSGLIGYWDMRDSASYSGTGANITDLSGNGNTAVIQNQYYDAQDSGTNDGTNTNGRVFVDTPDHFGLSGGPLTYTVSHWWFDNIYGNAGTSSIGYYSNTLFSMSHINSGFGRSKWTVQAHGTSASGDLVYRGAENNWYNIVLTMDNGVGNVYINGALNTQPYYYGPSISSGTMATTPGGAYLLTSNRGGYSAAAQHNRWAQSSIYNRALTASEVLTNFEALRGNFGI